VRALDEFNEEMATNSRLEAVLLPLYDGFGMARLVD
jgi:predicted O-methyltransferase YrrM